ncbi:hypothetical protein TNCV_1798381 [Trichonephila clavipes]|uniref:Uncharacterized protein n=1 Tax=Trichonephila clavipes TaxID=2585209 RepID=A0A8X6SFP1_TRICX|nr:hypothetical protein TNCV_1798381 [Trichonephila clavipes]
MLFATDPQVTSSILLIGDLDTELRKTQPSRCCCGAIYPSQEQSKIVRLTCRSNQEPSDSHDATLQSNSSNSHTLHTLSIANISFVHLSIDSLVGEYCGGGTYICE